MKNMIRNLLSVHQPRQTVLHLAQELPEYIKPFSMELGKIHIITGDNGSGKTVLLKSLANILMGNQFERTDIFQDSRLKLGSNNRKLCEIWIRGISNFKNLCTIKHNVVQYMDLSVEFHNTPSQTNDLYRLSDRLNGLSNGEQKINALNSIFSFYKLFVDVDDDITEDGFLEIFLLLDEPDNGLSRAIKLEFIDTIQYYMTHLDKRVRLTPIIVSHDHIWGTIDDVNILPIDELKIDHIKKRHVNVFTR